MIKLRGTTKTLCYIGDKASLASKAIKAVAILRYVMMYYSYELRIVAKKDCFVSSVSIENIFLWLPLVHFVSVSLDKILP